MPFFLNRGMTTTPKNKLKHYHEKFGEARVEQMVPFMTQKFKSIGIDYSMGGDIGHTMDSHRLIAYAEDFGTEKQNALVEELFDLYFSKETWLTKEALAQAAEKVGIPDAATYLADEKNGRDKVENQLQLGRERAVS